MNRNMIPLAAIAIVSALQLKAGIEPDAGTWRTWVVGNVSSLRLPPPPDDEATQNELQDVKAMVEARDAQAAQDIAYWNAGSPAYRWIQMAQKEVASHSLGGPAATRAMSLVAAALNDAMIAAWDSKYAYNRQRPSQIDTAIATAIAVPDSPSYPSEHATAAGVAAAVLAYLFPDHKDAFDLMAAKECQSRVYAGTEFPTDTSAGLWLGRTIGQAAIEWARTDGSDAVFTGSFPPAPGVWSNPNPAAPLAGTWRPWALASGSSVRLGPPPAFGSPEMQAQVDAVKQLNRTVVISRTAWVWQASSIDPWIDTVNQFLFESRLADDAPKAAQIYALALVAHHDATIACWDTKYTYLEPRPVQADPQIMTLFPTPAHPSYPSGHACASAATAGALASVFPDSAAYFSDRAREAGLSTFYGGVHYPNDVDAGLALGTAVAREVVNRAGLGEQ